MPSPMVELDVASLRFSMTPEVAALVRAGTLDPDVAYMQGKLKVAGDMASFFDLLPLAGSAGFRRALDHDDA
jgi:hypothetical protein